MYNATIQFSPKCSASGLWKHMWDHEVEQPRDQNLSGKIYDGIAQVGNTRK